MRNMSFMLTPDQLRQRTKDVTRRIGWWNITRGELIQACLQCQGLKKGETITRLCVLKILDARSEPLDRITAADVVREGFPNLTRRQFIDLFCKANKCSPDIVVNRIEFEYLKGDAS